MESAIPLYDEKKDQNIAHLGREFDVPYRCAQTIHGRNALSYHRADPLVLLSTRCLWFSTDRRRAKKGSQSDLFTQERPYTRAWKNWIYCFLSPLPAQFRLITCRTSDNNVIVPKMLTSIQQFFDQIKPDIASRRVRPMNIYNFDHTGFCILNDHHKLQ